MNMKRITAFESKDGTIHKTSREAALHDLMTVRSLIGEHLRNRLKANQLDVVADGPKWPESALVSNSYLGETIIEMLSSLPDHASIAIRTHLRQMAIEVDDDEEETVNPKYRYKCK
jgi:hypothetical protein